MSDNNFGYFNKNNRFNKRFGGLNNIFNNKVDSEDDMAAFIQFLLGMDSISNTSFGTLLEDKRTLDLCKSAAANLPENNSAPLKTDDFTEQVKIAIEDCFSGTVVRDGLGSICYVLPDNTVFKIQITKL